MFVSLRYMVTVQEDRLDANSATIIQNIPDRVNSLVEVVINPNRLV